MSTPSGKPFEVINNSDYRPRTQNQESSGRQPDEDEDPVLSAYAPKRARQRRAVSQADSDDASVIDLPLFLIGSNRRRAAVNPAGSLLRFDEHSANSNRADKPFEDKAAVESEIERLEASLRWLKRQGAELRQPHADPLIPPPPRQTARSAGEDMEVCRPLEPENLVAPALMRAQRRKTDGPFATMRSALLFLIAGLVAPTIAYFAAGSSAPPPGIAHEPTLATPEPHASLVPPVTALQNKVRPTENQIDDSGRVASSSGEISANATTSPAVPVAFLPAAFKDETVMLTTRSEAQTAPPPDRWPDPAHVQLKDETVMLATRSEAQTASPPVRRLDPAHVQLLVNRGEQFMAAGDVAAARVMFRRAAEAVDAGAALAMGATYDPLMLKKIGALGVAADPDEARSWYEKAQEFGSPEALRRLDLLANR